MMTQEPFKLTLQSLEVIKACKVEKYYDYWQTRKEDRLTKGEKNINIAEWQAMNDTVYQYAHEQNITLESIQLNQFIKNMIK